jgi:2-dehydro-3-deoxy-D-arabinonate dehydratase
VDEIVRFERGGGVAVGVRRHDGIHPLPAVTTLAHLLQHPIDDIRALLDSAESAAVDDVRLLAPIDERTEVWGAGVTYERSRVARVEESESSDVYDRVYAAERPELFTKAPAWRVITEGETVGMRRDSPLSVPEPELALWITAHGEIAGYLVCNDMTSRSVEAANPLYLPQAKVYRASCALSSGIVPAWEVPDAASLGVRSTITRGTETVWSAETSTASMARSFEELVSWLTAELDFPDGVILSTGTGIVPDLDFVLEPGDVIRIEIDGVGSLTNVAGFVTDR